MHERARAIVQMMGGFSIGFVDDPNKEGRPIIAQGLLRKFAGADAEPIECTLHEAEVYENLLDSTSLWHGTGRYYTNWHGECVDVLNGIIAAGGLKAAPDVTDHRAGRVEIVASSPSRTLARVYADSHSSDIRAERRNGTSSYWLGLHAGRVVRQMFTDNTVAGFSAHTLKESIKTGRLRQPHIQKESVMNAQGLLRGSKIANNYPIIIGINPSGLTPTIKHRQEVRFASVPLSCFTHIQVPSNKIDEVLGIIENNGMTLPVVSIEQAEAHDVQQLRKADQGKPGGYF